LEIRIGRFLDGELSPQERRLLESEMQQDRHAKELFEQMRVLHECSCGVVTHEVLERGADPAEVFERAWQQSQRSLWRRIAPGGHERQGWRWGARAEGYLRFAVGVAAGLLLGLVLRFGPGSPPQIPSNLTTSSQPLVAGNVPSDRYEQPEVIPARFEPRRINRQVDWLVYTDRDGNQWLIEGTREGVAKPAVYPNGL
jgi:anti-sigma factor RsiW